MTSITFECVKNPEDDRIIRMKAESETDVVFKLLSISDAVELIHDLTNYMLPTPSEEGRY